MHSIMCKMAQTPPVQNAKLGEIGISSSSDGLRRQGLFLCASLVKRLLIFGSLCVKTQTKAFLSRVITAREVCH